MKSASALFLLGVAALVVQGALARLIPPPWCPDLAWLVVVAMGLRWPSFVPGVVLAVVLGYGMDLLSGSLMGQHALLRWVSYLAAALAARQLDLSGGLPAGLFVFALTIAYGFTTTWMLAFFVGTPGAGGGVLGASAAHGIVNVLAMGPVLGAVERILTRFSDEDVGRRAPMPLGFDGRGFDGRGLGRGGLG